MSKLILIVINFQLFVLEPSPLHNVGTDGIANAFCLTLLRGKRNSKFKSLRMFFQDCRSCCTRTCMSADCTIAPLTIMSLLYNRLAQAYILRTTLSQDANVSKDRLTTQAVNKTSTFRAKALRLELASSADSRRRAFARNIEILFIAQLVS